MLDSSSQQIEYRVNSIESKKSEAEEIKYNNAWKCPKCGRMNPSYTGTCACGYYK